jgi:hypothetical protein
MSLLQRFLPHAERRGPNLIRSANLPRPLNGWGLLPFLPGLDVLTANDLRQQSIAISEFNPSRATIGSEKCS